MNRFSIPLVFRSALLAIAAFAGAAETQAGVVLSFQNPTPGTFAPSPAVSAPSPAHTASQFAGSNGLQQTFTVTTAFTLDKIVLSYLQGTSQVSDHTIEIFSVSDPLATPLTVGTNLLAGGGTLAFSINRTVATIPERPALLTLDLTGIDEITLAAGTYALSIKTPTVTTGANLQLGTFNTGSGDADSAYVGGALFSNRALLTSGTQDLAFALYAVPETSVGTCAIVGLSFFGCFARRRRVVKA